jgi:plastocyanin
LRIVERASYDDRRGETMRKTLLVFPLVLVVAAFGLAACGGDDEEGADTTETTTETTETGGAAGDVLVATVGPGFTITLTTPDGADVSTLEPGSYTIQVSDQSDIHNFYLTGPNVDESTTVEEVTEVTWEVDLEPGEFSFVCDPHASSMNGSFTVS